MWSSQITTLIVKDLRLHRSGFVLAILGLVLVLVLAAAVRLFPAGVGPRASLVFNVNMVFTLVWSDWLITRERSKRTFAWLRAMPVDDRALAGAKFLVAAGCCLTCFLVTSTAFARELWQPVGTGLVLQSSLLVIGGLSVSTKWRFPWRLGQILPMGIILVPVLLFLMLTGDGTDGREALIAMWNAPYGKAAAATLLLGVYAAIVATTLRWVTRADTFQLID